MWLLASVVTSLAFAGAAGPGDGWTAEIAPPGAPRIAVPQGPLQPQIDAAADEFGVPAVLLSALVWEASHYDPAVARQWAGYGPLDLREDADPRLEDAAIAADLPADLLITDPAANLRGGAALLAEQARRSNAGELPDPDLLEAWWDATRLFSGSHDPVVQRNFASYVFEQIWFGVDATAGTGELVRFGGIPVDLPGLLAGEGPTFPALPDFPGAVGFVAACSSNYSNYSRTGSDIEYVIVHTTQGSYSGTISWFQNCSASVSAHYVVRSSDGEITQMVDEEDVGWHAGNWTYNELSIGIEHEGFVEDPGTWYTDEMYAASAALVSDILTRTAVQPDRNHIIGHVEVPGATHTDPGSGWDWDYYMALIEGSWTILGDLTGVVAAEDVFTGARIAGATVTVLETGDTVTVGDDGAFLFEDLPEGDYTVHAEAPGYLPGECEKTIDASGTFWCSVPLMPDPGGSTTTPGDPPVEDPGVPPSSFTDSGRVPMESKSGCGCDGTGGLPTLALPLLAGLLIRRRR